ncbi:MAG: phosphoribosylanthranilate isomerase [Muribaculaceae bacterium]
MANNRYIAVKVCGMCRPDNIAQVAALCPDMMGFIFWSRSRRNALELKPRVVKALEGIMRVGVFVDASVDVVLHTADSYGIHMVQLHGSESPEMCLTLRSRGLKVAKAIGIAGETDLCLADAYRHCANFLVFDTKSPLHGGTGVAYDRSILSHYNGSVPFLLSGGVTTDDAASIKALNLPGMMGVDINSRFELSPGVKDVAAVARFIADIRNDDSQRL